VKVSAKEAQKSVEKSSRRLRSEVGAEAKPKRGGFLQSLGIGQDTYYPDGE
jgi:hypothetical protein